MLEKNWRDVLCLGGQEAVRVLVEAKATVDLQTINGISPLWTASAKVC